MQPQHYEYDAGAEPPMSPLKVTRGSVVVAFPQPASSGFDQIGGEPLSIALIAPHEERRKAAVVALSVCGNEELHPFTSYPPSLEDVPQLLDEKYDVIVVDLDSDPVYALGLVERVARNGMATVMVYSESAGPELLMRCMQAGAREFLPVPFTSAVVGEALVRAAARRSANRTASKATQSGRLLSFIGSKGGAGTTTLACNFAVSLARDLGRKTLLIDLNLPLGDAALNLGLTAEFSTIDALQAAKRLDGQFLSQLLVKHEPELWLLAAPGRFVPYQPSCQAVDRLLEVARQEFDQVVVDLGSKLDMMDSSAYKEADAVYLVTQASIPELRNSNRLISQFFSGESPRLEIVVNRYQSRIQGITEPHIRKALTRPVQWKIPNDFASVQEMQVNATPLVLGDSAVARQIKAMAKAALGGGQVMAEDQPKKRGFRLFG
jgi:pilus assembly protein CpaE